MIPFFLITDSMFLLNHAFTDESPYHRCVMSSIDVYIHAYIHAWSVDAMEYGYDYPMKHLHACI